ncbi:MAG: ornithine cyclodeaminase family protein [Pseudomonadota bacterium]
MQILSRNDIEARFNLDRAVSAIERCYQDYSAGRINHPPVGHIVFDEEGADCHLKYGQIRGDEHFVVKLAMGMPGNSKKGLPTGDGMLLVLSAKTGELLALLHDRMFLTDQRTAIGGAIASRWLARPTSRRLLIVGTGVQARYQLDLHRTLLPNIDSVEVWGRSARRAADLAEQALAEVSDDLAASCRRADVVVTTTAARSPIIKQEWIESGTHITAVGADAPGKQELATGLVARADVVVADSIAQCVDHGEIEVAIKDGSLDASSIRELGEVIAGRHRGRTSEEQISIVDLTGLAAQDIAIAKSVLIDEA